MQFNILSSHKIILNCISDEKQIMYKNLLLFIYMFINTLSVFQEMLIINIINISLKELQKNIHFNSFN